MSIFRKKEEKELKSSMDFYEESKRQFVDCANRMLKTMDTDITALLDLDEQSGRMLGIVCEYIKSSDELVKKAIEVGDNQRKELDDKLDSINEKLMKQNAQMENVLRQLQNLKVKGT